MKLKDLLESLELLEVHADLDMDCPYVSYNSKMTQPGDLFVALTGYKTDGHVYIPSAVEKGAVCVLCERRPEVDIPYVLVKDSRRALSVVGGNLFDHPSRKMTMVAVTGTSGKTSTTYLLKAVLEQAKGAKVGLIGTNQNMIGSEVIPTDRTTPESFEVQKLFHQMVEAGCSYCVMETSSHALYLDRVYGVHYEVGIFTNLTPEHLDFHITMENYCDAKGILFQNANVGVVNADNEWHERILAGKPCRGVTFGVNTQADLMAKDIELFADSIRFLAVTKEEQQVMEVMIPGEFMVYNTLGVLAAALQLGVSLEESARVLKSVPHIQGRVEVVPTPGKDYTVLIDYAHTPDAVENLLKTIRKFAKGRILFLFGCGGDRYRGDRPKIGRMVAEGADQIILTVDNSRTEPVPQIHADILEGMKGSTTPCEIIVDRREAIFWAMDHAQKDDLVVLCGKGHETYLEVNGVKTHFDEREVVQEYLDQNK